MPTLSSIISLSGQRQQSLSEGLGAITASRAITDPRVTSLVLSAESADQADQQTIANTFNALCSGVRELAANLNYSVEDHHIAAAALGGMISADPKKFLQTAPSARPGARIIGSGHGDASHTRALAVEAYDERENRHAMQQNLMYNLLASHQDAFSEGFFGTIVIPPTEVGLEVKIPMLMVFNDFKRSVTGSLANYGRKNVVRGFRDHTLLRNDALKVVPVLRAGGGADDNSQYFVDTALVPSWSEDMGNGIVVPTGALRVDMKSQLLGLSQHNELLNSGVMGPTDQLDSYARLEKLWVRFTNGGSTDVVEIDAAALPGSLYTYTPQGNSRRMQLMIDTDSLVMGVKTTKVSGAALEALTELATHNVRVQLSISGSLVLDKSDSIVNRGSLQLTTMRNAAGQLITGAPFNALAAKIAAGEIIGYSIDTNRANSNLRSRGQLFDAQTELRILGVEYRSLRTVLIPPNSDTERELQAARDLGSVTAMYVCNEAVSALFRFDNQLNNYIKVPDANGELPEISAVSFGYITPTYFRKEVDLAEIVDSKRSAERFADIRGAIVEKLRFYASEMYAASGYKAAATLLTGNPDLKPTVVIGTGLVLANYLQVEGDPQLLGPAFDTRIVVTQDDRMANTIFMTFGLFDASRNSAVSPLNFGSFLSSPELAAVNTIERDGQSSREIMVTPRFSHEMTMPVLTRLTVTGLPEVTDKVAIKFDAI